MLKLLEIALSGITIASTILIGSYYFYLIGEYYHVKLLEIHSGKVPSDHLKEQSRVMVDDPLLNDGC